MQGSLLCRLRVSDDRIETDDAIKVCFPYRNIFSPGAAFSGGDLDVRIHLWRVAGIVLALAGLFLMTVPGGPGGVAYFANVNLGDLLTVGCAICFTFHVIFVGRASQRFPFEQVAFLQVGTAAILMILSRQCWNILIYGRRQG